LDNLLNAGIASEVLDNNIGYLKIIGDLDFPKSINLVEQYFNELCGVGALIIDLRSVDKGSLVLTQKIIGFFVKPGTAVGSVKLNNHFEILKSIETKGFKKFKQNFPLYILNSAFVTGPWELFSFSLQALNKSIVVGELTMGVGFANTSVDVSNNIAIEMTSAIVAGPDPTVTWNDEGVVPDYFTKPKEAVKKTYDLALTQISQ
jgi:C-terminal processing protease CtpA/Prc